MPILSQPSFGPRTALIYVTGGALIDVWTLVWYFTREAPLTPRSQFWVIGLALTGLTFVTLGLLLGRLARSARHAELPPPEVLQAEANIQQTAAANPSPVMMQGGTEQIPVNASVAPVVRSPSVPAASPAPSVRSPASATASRT